MQTKSYMPGNKTTTGTHKVNGHATRTNSSKKQSTNELKEVLHVLLNPKNSRPVMGNNLFILFYLFI